MNYTDKEESVAIEICFEEHRELLHEFLGRPEFKKNNFKQYVEKVYHAEFVDRRPELYLVFDSEKYLQWFRIKHPQMS